MTKATRLTPKVPLHYEKHMDERHADLKDRVSRLEVDCEKKYTTKSHFYWVLGIVWFALGASLCTAYYKVNPSEVKSEVSKVEGKLDILLQTLQSK